MIIRGGFFDRDCPARGPGLSHAHWSRCGELHSDPRHADDECCHCSLRASAPSAPPPPPPPPDDERPSAQRHAREWGWGANLEEGRKVGASLGYDRAELDRWQGEMNALLMGVDDGVIALPRRHEYSRRRTQFRGLTERAERRLEFYVLHLRRDALENP